MISPKSDLNLALLVVRLKFVHAQATYDRWTEEQHLLHEELQRIGLAFRHEVQLWNERCARGLRMVGLGGSGYRAFCRERAAEYEQMAKAAEKEHALSLLSTQSSTTS